jgi:alkylhydroperoxidase/carboxymuconolactone decarboxylase family protein YurZ
MLEPKQEQAFNEFQTVTHNNDILKPKTTIMLDFAVAMAVGCYRSMEQYLGVARKEGITEMQIGVVHSIVMSLAGCRVRLQLQ